MRVAPSEIRGDGANVPRPSGRSLPATDVGAATAGWALLGTAVVLAPIVHHRRWRGIH